MELFPPWFDNSRVRHAGLPRKAAVPPLGPVWPLPPIAGSEFSPSSGSTHFNKTNHNHNNGHTATVAAAVAGTDAVAAASGTTICASTAGGFQQ